MSTSSSGPHTGTPTTVGAPGEGTQPSGGPTAEELRGMSREQVMIAGAEADGVHIVHRRERFPIPGTKGEKRTERAVAATFLLAALCGIGFIVWFCAGNWHWEMPGADESYKFYTPVLGALLGGLLLFMGMGLVLWAKWLMPEEEVIQERHDDPTGAEDLLMTEATVLVGLDDTGLPRRSLLLRSLGLAGGALAAAPLVALVGGIIKKPKSDELFHTLYRPNTKLFPNTKGRVPLVYSDFRWAGPDDLLPGSVATVFPGVREEVNGVNGLTSASSPTLLIRLRPDQTIQPRQGQESYAWPPGKPDYVAFSKICTHAGCPASLYEQQTGRLVCPCHQSQFDVLKDAKPVFGPATRSLPQLPLDVVTGDDGKLKFVARHDFPEAIGPGFWERP